MEKLILTAAITGAELDKAKCPILPITPQEQAQAARECVEAGTSVIHLHGRDDAGGPSRELALFRRWVEAIQRGCPQRPIIQFSPGGGVGEPMERRLASLQCK